jgi:hypothetical protein
MIWLPSSMRMLRNILPRTTGTSIFHWPFDYTSCYVPGDDGLWMLEYWWIRQRIMLPLVKLPWTSSILIYHPQGQLEIQHLNWLDQSYCLFRKV